MTRAVVVSIHDVSPRTRPVVEQILAVLDRLGADRRSLLVIPAEPGYAADEAPGFGEWLRSLQAAGDEIVQHGLYHRRAAGEPPLTGGLKLVDAVLARGAAEFIALDQATAARRLAEGRERLARLGLHPGGFAAPAWLGSPDTVRALAADGYRYYTTHLRVRDLHRGRSHWAFGTSNRPGPLGPDLVGRGVNEAFELLHRPLPLLRIGIHPADWGGHHSFGHTVRLLRRVLRAGREPVTYLDWLDSA